MAKFTIYSKKGIAICEGCPVYNGTYLNVPYLEFEEIASPTPIEWSIGDYVEYSRTGMTYRLYSVPQPTKQARRGSRGDSFIYESVQFFGAEKQLDTVLFSDVVTEDNGIHFSSRSTVSTYENVYGIADRIQECMEQAYPSKWSIRVTELAETDADLKTLLETPKAFSVDNGTCLAALSAIYNTWEGIGWIHTYEDGRDVITIGRPNKRTEDNTSSPFMYGKGNGLSLIRKSYSNRDEIATRLYVYGSERNMISRYYNGKDILHAESVDIPNLMIPVDTWGKTADASGTLKPDPAKAYIEDPRAIDKWGLIPKRVYFDGSENDEIYPSIEGMTAGSLRAAKADLGDKENVPNSEKYPDEERLDEIASAEAITDDGVDSPEGERFNKVWKKDRYTKTWKAKYELNVMANPWTPDTEGMTGTLTYTGEEKVTVDYPSDADPVDGLTLTVSRYQDVLPAQFVHKIFPHQTYLFEWPQKDPQNTIALKREEIMDEQGKQVDIVRYTAILPEATRRYPMPVTGIYYTILKQERLEHGVSGTPIKTYPSSRLVATTIDVTPIIGINYDFTAPFTVRLKQIGFDISSRLGTNNDGKATLSMKSGMCGGRDFTIQTCKKDEANDGWILTLARVKDDSVGMYYPNANFPIQAGDRFVILDIVMPELYIAVASERLLEVGRQTYEQTAKGVAYYEPAIDSMRLAKSGEKLTEGMYMALADEDIIEGGTEYILIDTLKIDEGESNIPVYEVTLRERKGISFAQSMASTVRDINAKIAYISGGGAARRIPLITSDSDMVPSDLNAWSGLRATQEFLQKTKEDTATAKQTFASGAAFGDYVAGETGMGAQIDGQGNAEFQTLSVRSSLIVPNLQYNRTSIENGVKWNAPGGGVIEKVEPDYNDDGTLGDTGTLWVKLTEGEVPAVAEYDLCMGVFHDMVNTENNAKNDYDSGCSSDIVFAGFYTAYFYISGASLDAQNKFRYEVREGTYLEGGGSPNIAGTFKNTKYHPCAGMTFVCFGNNSNKDRQTSRYSTRTYERFLKDVGNFTWTTANLAMQFGDLSNLKALGFEEDMEGYSAYLQNIYMTGAIKSVGKDGSFSLTKEGLLSVTGANIQGKITASTGRIGLLNIGDGLSYKNTETDEQMELSIDRIWFDANGIFAALGAQASSVLSDIDKNALNIDINNTGTMPGYVQNVGIYVNVTGAKVLQDSLAGQKYGNFAMKIASGEVCGLRPVTRMVTASTTLSEYDHTIICIRTDGKTIQLTLPKNPQNGQRYEILSSGNVGRQVLGNGTNITWPGVYTGSNQTLQAGDAQIMLLIYNSANGDWLMRTY